MLFAVLLCSTAVFFSTKKENNSTIPCFFSVKYIYLTRIRAPPFDFEI